LKIDIDGYYLKNCKNPMILFSFSQLLLAEMFKEKAPISLGSKKPSFRMV